MASSVSETSIIGDGVTHRGNVKDEHYEGTVFRAGAAECI